MLLSASKGRCCKKRPTLRSWEVCKLPKAHAVHFLRQPTEFGARYGIIYVCSYALVSDAGVADFSSAEAKAVLAAANLIIHQPIAERHGNFATEIVMSLFGKGRVLGISRSESGSGVGVGGVGQQTSISFPYIYNGALWAMVPTSSETAWRESSSGKRGEDKPTPTTRASREGSAGVHGSANVLELVQAGAHTADDQTTCSRARLGGVAGPLVRLSNTLRRHHR